MEKIKTIVKPRLKALVALVVAFIAALVAQVQSGSTFNEKTLLLALGTAVVTATSVHTVPNL